MTMRSAILLGGLLLATACSVKLDGPCTTDSDCNPGAFCTATNAGMACVIPEGGCFPKCDQLHTCTTLGTGPTCVANLCPVGGCQVGYTCSQSTNFTCQLITAAVITLTTPGDGTFAGANLVATATALAPGGTTGVMFVAELLDGGQPVTTTATKMPTATDPENYTATVPLTSFPDGPVSLQAVESFPALPDGGTMLATQPPITIKVDLTPPAVTLVTDGRSGYLGPGNSPALITASASDTGSGVTATGVTLTVPASSHPTYPATAGANNQFTFSVPFADVAATGTLPYSIAATDAVGNMTTVSGDAREVIKVDATAPTGTLTVDNTWHAANEMVTVTGTAVDAQSGLVGGLAGVSLTAGTQTAAGTITGSTYSVTGNLATQTFPATENSAFPITVKVSDQVGNVLTLNGSLKVDNKPPTIGTPMVPTGDSGKYFKTSGADIPVTVTVLDAGSGVKNSTVSMQYQFGAGAAQTLAVTGVPGTPNADGTENWTFNVPRSLGTAGHACGTSACDGSAPVLLTVVAQDNLGHAATSSSGMLFFDGVGPTFTFAADSTFYGPTATIAVSATVSEAGSGVDSATVFLNDGKTNYATTNACANNTCTFQLPVTNFPASTEGAFALTLSGSDKLGNASAVANGSRNVDKAGPVVTFNSIYPTVGGVAGPTGQVVYPGTKPNTGYQDGVHFLINDSIHISAKVADGGSGVMQSSLMLRIDGTANGVAQLLTPTASCDGHSSCSIEVDMALNGANSGAFNQASGNYTVNILASDKVTNAATPGTITVAATRFWWSRELSGLTISGLALHPSGDVVASGTTSNQANTQDTVYDLYKNGPFTADGTGCATGGIRWCYGSADSIGSVASAPAIGEESTAGAKDSRIYIATNASGMLLSLDQNGNRKWIGAAATFSTTPAVAKVTITGVALPAEVAVAGAQDDSFYSGRESPTTPGTSIIKNSGDSGDEFVSSSPVFVGGAFYAANNTAVQRASIQATGTFTAFSVYSESAANLTGIAYGGSSLLYAATMLGGSGAKSLQQFTAANPPVRGWASPDPDLGKPAAGDPIVGNGVVFVATASPDKKLQQVAIADKSIHTVQTYGAAANTALLGSDGRLYITLTDGNVYAVNVADGSSQWNVKPGSSSGAPPTMDCSGHVYVGIGDTVYAYLSDATGLGNTTWPKFHRDTRNSGNADLATVWGARNGTNCTE